MSPTMCTIPMADGTEREVEVGTVVEMTNGPLCLADVGGFRCLRRRIGDGSPWRWPDDAVLRVFAPEPSLYEANMAAFKEEARLGLGRLEPTPAPDLAPVLAEVRDLVREIRDGLAKARTWPAPAPTPPVGTVLVDRDGDLWRVEGVGRCRLWGNRGPDWAPSTSSWRVVTGFGPLRVATAADLDAAGVPQDER